MITYDELQKIKKQFQGNEQVQKLDDSITQLVDEQITNSLIESKEMEIDSLLDECSIFENIKTSGFCERYNDAILKIENELKSSLCHKK